jgi:hypothetical protein
VKGKGHSLKAAVDLRIKSCFVILDFYIKIACDPPSDSFTNGPNIPT